MTSAFPGGSHPPAEPFLAVEIFFRLMGSTDPHELAPRLTDKLRELSGARTVLLVAHDAGAVGGHRVLHVSPPGRADLLDEAALSGLCLQRHPDTLPWRVAEYASEGLRAVLQAAGVRVLLRLPLQVGGELLGMLLLLDVQDEARLGETEAIGSLLAPYFAMALKQGLDHQKLLSQAQEIERHARALEERVDARTRELEEAVQTLKASRLAALNLMEDAIEAQGRAEALSLELSQKNQELEDLLYAASHDLRSPLLNVRGFAEDLAASCRKLEDILGRVAPEGSLRDELDGLTRDRIPSALRFILAGSDKLGALIDGLLAVSRAGRREMSLETLDMQALLTLVINATAYQIQASGAQVELGPLPPCHGDRGLINQVFTNLLDNALKYRHPDRPPRIRISGRVEATTAMYCVEDNGIGIEPRHHARIWKLFHRLDPQGAVTGEGLGLSLVDRILKRHQGKAWVESRPGEGSRFFVALPAEGPCA